MSVEPVLLVAAFLVLLALPLVPGFRELLRPRDDRPLEIDVGATVDPRQPGRSFRDGLRPLLARAGRDVPRRGSSELERPAGDACLVHQDLTMPTAANDPGPTIVLGKADVGERARLREVYVRGDAVLGGGVRVRALAADGDLRLGADCVVEQWLDVEGSGDVGARSSLGSQASAAGRLRLEPGCTFRRLWGQPVSTEATGPGAARADTAPPAPAGLTLDDRVVWTGRQLTVPRDFTFDRDLVVHGEVRVSSGNRVRGSIKAHGHLHLLRGVEVDGSLVSRRSIRIDGPATIRGNVFAEGDIVIGPGTTIGAAGGIKSVYARGRLELAPDVRVFGWIVADEGGRVAGPAARETRPVAGPGHS
jgi:predicted acyltransferase (DUF342 family)